MDILPYDETDPDKCRVNDSSLKKLGIDCGFEATHLCTLCTQCEKYIEIEFETQQYFDEKKKETGFFAVCFDHLLGRQCLCTDHILTKSCV